MIKEAEGTDSLDEQSPRSLLCRTRKIWYSRICRGQLIRGLTEVPGESGHATNVGLDRMRRVIAQLQIGDHLLTQSRIWQRLLSGGRQSSGIQIEGPYRSDVSRVNRG